MGEIFGHYRLERLLGSGRVGEVWQAEDTNLDRLVALKRLKPWLQIDSEALARFKREAKAAARLRHPHIVRVHNSGVIDGRHSSTPSSSRVSTSIAFSNRAGCPSHAS